MDLAIRVNVRYAAPPNSHIKDALRLFKSPRWVQSIIRYIMPQLNSVSPASLACVDALKKNVAAASPKDACVVCMDQFHQETCVELPCQHRFHVACIDPWLKLHSTCPTCRHQLPTDAFSNYSVYAINTTIILQQSQANMPTAQLLDLPASNQVIRAVVNARVRRNPPCSGSGSRSMRSTVSTIESDAATASTSTLTSTSTATGTETEETSMCCGNLNRVTAMLPPVMNAQIMQSDQVAQVLNESFESVDQQLEECQAAPRTSTRPAPLTRRRCREANASNKRARLDPSQPEIASSV